jgi:ubiquinone/menaquinone biosynthesis C-methylase UbiE
MTGPRLSPQRILDLNWSHSITHTLITAVELQVFTQIERGTQTVPALARAAGASPRGMRMLANALVGLGLLKKVGERYRLTPESAEFLVVGKPTYIGAMIERARVVMSAWARLTEAVRQGRPVVVEAGTDEARAAFFAELVKALFSPSYQRGRRAAVALRERGYRYQQILDVGAGSAGWSIPFAELDSHTQVTALDFPKVVEVTREYVANHNLDGQFHYLPGNLRELPFGQARYDLIILGNICHSEGAASTRKLFRKCYRALKPKGHALIVEPLPNHQRTGPVFPLLFALNMLLYTQEGDTYTEAEYRAWLKEAGFSKPVTFDVGSASPLLLSMKR